MLDKLALFSILYAPVLAFIFSRFTSLPSYKVLAVIFFIPLTIIFLVRNSFRKTLRLPSYLLFYLIFAFIATAVRVIKAPMISYATSIDYRQFFIGIECIIGYSFFVVENLDIKDIDFKYLQKHVVILIVLSFLGTIGEYTVGSVALWGTYYALPQSFWGYFYYSGIALSVPFLAALYLHSSKLRKRDYFLFATMAFSVLVSMVRYGWGSMVIVSLSLPWASKKINNKLNLKPLFGVILIMGLSIFVATTYFTTDRSLVDRFKDKSYTTRLFAYNLFYRFAPKSIDEALMGATLETNNKLYFALAGRSSQIHVGWLNISYYYGYFVYFFFLLYFGSYTRRAWRVKQKTSNYGVFVGLLTFAFANFTGSAWTLYSPPIILGAFYARILLAKGMDDTPQTQQNHVGYDLTN